MRVKPALLVRNYDHYPFGMIMPGRKYDAGSGYRYGFNGQEKSPEIMENSTSALFWEYDSRIGRRWNIDPASSKYPHESPFLVFHNNPLYFQDPKGDDPPANFKKHSGRGGDLYLPENAVLNTSTSKGKNGTTKTNINGFSIEGKTYSAKYNKKHQFLGYYNGDSKYKNPDITIKPGTDMIYGNNLITTLDIKNVPADGLQMIQTVQSSASVKRNFAWNGVWFDENGFNSKGTPPFDDNGTKMQSEVDGGVNSIYALTLQRQPDGSFRANGEANPGLPYYLSPLQKQLKVQWNGDNGTIETTDMPNAQGNVEKIIFTTMIVATNYMGSGKDVLLATFRWGWTGYGTIPASDGKVSIKGNIPNEIELNTISSSYPNYPLIK